MTSAFKFVAPLALSLGLAFAGITGAQAQNIGDGVINFHFDGHSFSTYSGSGAANAPGTFWTNYSYSGVSGTTFTGLSDSNGTATGVGLNLSAALGSYSTSQPSGAPSLFSSWGYTNNAVGAGDAPASSTLTITGLSTAKTYTLYVYGLDDTVGRGSAFTVGSTTLSTTGATGAFSNGGNYVVFSNLAASNGSLSFTVAPRAGQQYGAINGFQLVAAAPEPSQTAALGLGLLGLAGLALKARRRSAA